MSRDPMAAEAVYLLVGLAVLAWLQQLVLDLTQPSTGSYSIKFFIFASAVMYNFLSIVHCLVLVLRGDGIAGWRMLLIPQAKNEGGTQDVEDAVSVA